MSLVISSFSTCKSVFESGLYSQAIALADSQISKSSNVILCYSSQAQSSPGSFNDACRKMARLNLVTFDENLSADILIWGRHRNATIHVFTKLNVYDGANWELRSTIVNEKAEKIMGCQEDC